MRHSPSPSLCARLSCCPSGVCMCCVSSTIILHSPATVLTRHVASRKLVTCRMSLCIKLLYKLLCQKHAAPEWMHVLLECSMSCHCPTTWCTFKLMQTAYRVETGGMCRPAWM